MYQSSLFPLRTIVGNAIPLGKEPIIRKVFESTESKNLEIEYDFSSNPSIIETQTDPHYSKYLPAFGNGATFLPGEGMDILPIPNPRPFGNDDQAISFFALSKKQATTDVSRKLSVRFSLLLPDKFLVGGICFGGFPYLPCSRRQTELGPFQGLSQGLNSANFGLPREVRLTCAGATTADQKDAGLSFEFLDSEISATKQEIVSHSGFHFLCIDPTLTDFVTVHFSDYPTILTKVKLASQTGEFGETERYGFIIPYFYLFQYQEKTRYRPVVSAGLLGTTSNKGPAIQQINPLAAAIDHRHVVAHAAGSNYFDFTAASIFGQQRRYIIRDELYDGNKSKSKVSEECSECFISIKVPPGKNVVLFVEQGEEYERCVAGLKIFLPFIPEVALKEDVEKISAAIREFYPDSPDLATLIENVPREHLETFLRFLLKIPKDIDFCEKIGIKVYELDPLEGVSPLDVPLNDKYATLLAEKEIDELSEISLALFLEGVRFVRPSNSRFFAIELTNLDSKAGQFVVKGMKLMQSAHVSVHPRAARTQQVKTLNFRIIGAELAEDYSFLGNEGFNFSIERFVAGERKSVLFRANSLLDLLHTGAAKIFSNARRRAVEFEKSEYNLPINKLMNESGENFESRYSEARFNGWRRSETGKGVGPKVIDKYDWNGNKKPDKFENYSSQEIRTHTNILFPDASLPEWGSAAIFANGMSIIYDGGDVIDAILTGNTSNLLLPTYKASDNNNTHQLVKGFSKYWEGINKNRLKVTGSLSVNQSPYGYTIATGQVLNDLVSLFDGLSPTDIPAMLNVFLTLGGLLSTLMPNSPTSLALLLPTLNGLNLGLSLTAAGLGLAANPAPGTFLPAVSQNASIGSQGTIGRQAVKSGYLKSQFLNNSYDEGNGYTRFEAGEMKRIITRKEVPDTEQQRIKGAEVMWQGELVDIITGAIPLNFTLPATAGKMHFRTSDDSLRVRFGSGVGKSISVDFWFDLTEEIIRDDN